MEEKYLKYKNKYLSLKNHLEFLQIGGAKIGNKIVDMRGNVMGTIKSINGKFFMLNTNKQILISDENRQWRVSRDAGTVYSQVPSPGSGSSALARRPSAGPSGMQQVPSPGGGSSALARRPSAGPSGMQQVPSPGGGSSALSGLARRPSGMQQVPSPGSSSSALSGLARRPSAGSSGMQQVPSPGGGLSGLARRPSVDPFGMQQVPSPGGDLSGLARRPFADPFGMQQLPSPGGGTSSANRAAASISAMQFLAHPQVRAPEGGGAGYPVQPPLSPPGWNVRRDGFYPGQRVMTSLGKGTFIRKEIISDIYTNRIENYVKLDSTGTIVNDDIDGHYPNLNVRELRSGE